MSEDPLIARIAASVLDGDGSAAAALARFGLAQGVSPTALLDGIVAALGEVGRMWEEGEFFLPELVAGAQAVTAALEVVRPALAGAPAASCDKVVVIGTVQGDIHDIGKNLVASLLTAHGFQVVDLGTDVSPGVFADAVREHCAAILCASALLTTTMLGQRAVVEELRARGLRDSVKVLVGGAPVSAAWAREIGADGTAEDAFGAARLARALVLP